MILNNQVWLKCIRNCACYLHERFSLNKYFQHVIIFVYFFCIWLLHELNRVKSYFVHFWKIFECMQHWIVSLIALSAILICKQNPLWHTRIQKLSGLYLHQLLYLLSIECLENNFHSWWPLLANSEKCRELH